MAKSQLSPELLRELVRYEPETGHLYWLDRDISFFTTQTQMNAWHGQYSGKQALTCLGQDGYFKGAILKRCYRAHRVAWALVHGEWPNEIDHLNHVRTDNRLKNLRDVTLQINRRNQTQRNPDKPLGLSPRTKGKWAAFVCKAGKNTYLGTFATKELADQSRRVVLSEMGYHENHGQL